MAVTINFNTLRQRASQFAKDFEAVTSENKSDQVYYNEIVDNFKDKYSIEHIKKVFDIVEFNKTNTFTYKQMMNNIYCDGLCGECESNEYCF